MVKEIDIQFILHGSDSISETEKSQLSDLAEEFPWSEPVQQAWLKALYQTQDSRFHKELERVAFISSDRKALYQIIYGQALKKTIEKVENELISLEAGTFIPEWQKVEKTGLEKKEQNSFTENKQLEEPEANVPEIPVGSALIPELVEQIKLTAADAIISKEILEDIEIKKEEIEKEEKVSPEKPFHSGYTSSDDFINWLILKASEIEYPSFERENYKKPKSGKDVNSLIDNFINKDPKITPGKSREYGLEDLAKESLVDNEEFVTETLAEIYASQGNFNKAKRAFELLSLKYPEKSIYFAARIKKLGKKK